MSAKRKKRETGRKPLAKALVMGTLTGSLVWIGLLIAASLLIVRGSEPEKLILPCVFLLAACAAASAGAVCSRFAACGVLVSGLAVGGILLCVVWVLSLALAFGTGGSASPALKVLLCAEFPLFATIGAKLACGKSAAKRRR